MSPKAEVDWKAVIDAIIARDPRGEELLYRNLESGARFFFQRRLGIQDVEDRVHDLFVVLVESVRSGAVREPERFMGFVRTILYRQLNRGISRAIESRETMTDLGTTAEWAGEDATPEQKAIEGQQIRLMQEALRTLKKKDSEVLTRFYLREQPRERIQAEMGLSETQFNLLKTRAKAKLVEGMKRKLEQLGN
jgi:RNA polymerase sigma factor (sigma-70 family)